MITLAGFLALLAPVLGPDGVESARPGDPFRAAALTPPDVRLYIHVNRAAAIRAEVADRPLAEWATNLFGDGQAPQAWARLAEAVELGGPQLFDTFLGTAFTLVVRGREEAAEWAVLTEVDPSDTRLLLSRLDPRVLGPRHRLPILHLPEHELQLAFSGRLLLIGPVPQSGLFDEMVPNLVMPPQECLANDPAIAQARELGGGGAGLFMRHEPPMGGWSVAVADLHGPSIRLRYAAKFDHAPFTTVPTKLQWDLTPIHNLRGKTALAFMEPTDASGGPLDAFLQVALGKALMTPDMRRNLGPRRLTVFGELDGRLENPPFDLLLPTVARVYEVMDNEQAWAQLDEQMIGLVATFNTLGEDAFELDVPDPAMFEAGEPRRVEVGPAARWLLGDIPGVDRVSLNWTVIKGQLGSWSVIASDPGHLATIAEALSVAPAGEPIVGPWESSGTADGPRLASIVRSWRDRTEVLAEPGRVDDLRSALLLFSTFGQGIQRCDWQMTRPSANQVLLEAELTLTAPDSSR